MGQSSRQGQPQAGRGQSQRVAPSQEESQCWWDRRWGGRGPSRRVRARQAPWAGREVTPWSGTDRKLSRCIATTGPVCSKEAQGGRRALCPSMRGPCWPPGGQPRARAAPWQPPSSLLGRGLCSFLQRLHPDDTIRKTFKEITVLRRHTFGDPAGSLPPTSRSVPLSLSRRCCQCPAHPRILCPP